MEIKWQDEAGSSGLEPGAVIVSSFPSAGLAATVAAHYMVQALKLPRIGIFDGPDMAPIAVVQDGVVNPPIRVYGQKDFAAILSEFPPTPALASALATTILNGAIQRKARMIVCFEGVVPHPLEEGQDPAAEAPDEKVWVAFARKDPAITKTFEPTQAGLLEDGVLGGVSGALLVQGINRSIPVAVLLVSARAVEGLPDHRAGAALIETFDRLLPELKIDTGPLRVEAERIERALRAAMKTHGKSEAAGKAIVEPASADMYR
ncbi:MAG: PAC2 family protein [Thermoplasmata archaeon]